jgi:protein-tyrosine phosphatase
VDQEFNYHDVVTQKVMMVCLGNICRSPMAAAVLDNKARATGVAIEVASSGTASWHAGDGPNHLSHLVWSEAGYVYDHIAQHFTPHMFDEYDLILVMDHSNYADVTAQATDAAQIDKVRFLRSFDPDLADIDVHGPDADRLTVPDPWNLPRSEFEAVLAMVERSVDGLLQAL